MRNFVFLTFFLCSLIAQPLTAAVSFRAADSDIAPTGLTAALQQAEAALSSDPPSPSSTVDALVRLQAIEAGDWRSYADLLQRLEFQLQDLAFARASQLADADWWRPRLDEARDTLGLLARKQALPATASTALLTAPPDGDDCADAIAVTPGDLSGTLSGATSDGDASCGDSSTAPDVWYVYTATSEGLVTFDTFWSDVEDTVLSLHSTCPDAEGNHELACNDDSFDLWSRVGRQMESGETVWLRVADPGGAGGDFELTVDDSVAGISGRVTERATGELLSDGWVMTYNPWGNIHDWAPIEDDGSYLVLALSNQDGYVKAEHPDFVDVFWPDDSCSLEICEPPSLGTPIPVAEDLVAGIDFALDPAGGIAGTVTSEQTGDPLRAYLSIYRPEGSLQDLTYTLADGTYLRDLPKGTYSVYASATGYRPEVWNDLSCIPSCHRNHGDPVSVTAGQTSEGIDFQLTLQGSVSGHVTDAVTGLPLAGRVNLITLNEVVGTWVEADGSYRIAGVEPGTYHMFASASGGEHVDELYGGIPCHATCPLADSDTVQVVLSVDTSGIDFTLDRRGSIRGRVTNRDGEPVLGRVEAEPDPRDIFQSPSAEVQPDGTYELLNLTPGVYEVWILPHDTAYENTLYDGLGFDPNHRYVFPNIQPPGTPVSVAPAASVTGIDFVVDRCSAYHSHLWARNYLPASAFGADGAYEACRTILVTDVTLDPWEDVVLRAGESVSLGNGFSVASGGRLVIEIDPGVASD